MNVSKEAVCQARQTAFFCLAVNHHAKITPKTEKEKRQTTHLQLISVLSSTPDENRTHIVGTGIRYSIH